MSALSPDGIVAVAALGALVLCGLVELVLRARDRRRARRRLVVEHLSPVRGFASGGQIRRDERHASGTLDLGEGALRVSVAHDGDPAAAALLAIEWHADGPDALLSGDDGAQRDARSDSDDDLVGAVRDREANELGLAAPQDGLDALQVGADRLVVAGDLEVAVPDGGHAASPAVEAGPAPTGPVDGAPGVPAPGADALTVGDPADTPALFGRAVEAGSAGDPVGGDGGGPSSPTVDPLAAALAAFLEALTDRWGVALEDVESVRLEGDYAPHAAPQVLVRSRLFVQGPVTRDLFVTLPTDGAR